MEETILKTPKLPLGRVVMTRGVSALLGEDEPLGLLLLLDRHVTGDWGDVCEEDAQANDRALTEGTRILSAYTFKGEPVWIITEWDRSVTTILEPSEY